MDIAGPDSALPPVTAQITPVTSHTGTIPATHARWHQTVKRNRTPSRATRMPWPCKTATKEQTANPIASRASTIPIVPTTTSASKTATTPTQTALKHSQPCKNASTATPANIHWRPMRLENACRRSQTFTDLHRPPQTATDAHNDSEVITTSVRASQPPNPHY
jgi:hypothetical protein